MAWLPALINLETVHWLRILLAVVTLNCYLFFTGDPLYVGMDLTIASFDSISEVNMVRTTTNIIIGETGASSNILRISICSDTICNILLMKFTGEDDYNIVIADTVKLF